MTYDIVARERVTEDRIRKLDTMEIVDEIHALEDKTDIFEDALDAIVRHSPANGEDCAYLTAKNAMSKAYPEERDK